MLLIVDALYKINDYKVFAINNLTIDKNSSWAFVGRNGSGKSSLVKALAGEQTLLSGLVNNQFKSIARISLEQLQKLVEEEWQRNNTDMVSEGEDDIGLTTAQIIQEEHKNNERCQELAKQFGISHLLTRRFKYLSTGETRKTLLCRVLMANPELLILDEPFDGLDVNSRSNLAELLKQLSQQGITILFVLNRFNDIPAFIENVGILIDCQLITTGKKDILFVDDTIKELAALENLQSIHLPDSDEVPTVMSANIARIILNNGYIHYNDKAIIKNLTWQVNANEHWQIVGPNGAGKSTLLNLITGDHPQGYSNDLTLFGRKRGSGETIWDIKRHIGYVSSSFHLDYRVSVSVKSVLLSGYFDSIGIYNATSDKQNKLAEEWLQLLNLSAQASQPFQSLSWGQQRLVLIARALVKHPTLLILDEPLQGLDQLNRELVKRWIDLLIKEGHSQLLFVSHHAEDAPECITHRLTFVPNDNDGYQYKVEILI